MVRQILSALVLAMAAFVLPACDQLHALGGPTHSYVFEVDQEALAESGREDADVAKLIEQSTPILAERLAGLGVIIHGYTQNSSGQLVVELSGHDHERAVASAAGGNVDLMIAAVDMTADAQDVVAGIAPPGSRIFPGTNGQPSMAVKRLGSLTGRDIDSAMVGDDPQSDSSLINVVFSERGAKKFGRLSTQYVGQPIAIVIDGEVVSAPIIMEPILGGMVQITGGFPEGEATELAVKLSSGELPAPLRVAEVIAIE